MNSELSVMKPFPPGRTGGAAIPPKAPVNVWTLPPEPAAAEAAAGAAEPAADAAAGAAEAAAGAAESAAAGAAEAAAAAPVSADAAAVTVTVVGAEGLGIRHWIISRRRSR